MSAIIKPVFPVCKESSALLFCDLIFGIIVLNGTLTTIPVCHRCWLLSTCPFYQIFFLQMSVTHSLFIMSPECVCVTNVGHPSLLVISPVCVTDVRCSQPIYHVTCVCVIIVGHPSVLVISPICVTDAVFGSSLQDLCDRDKSPVPSFVLLCITAVESKGTFFVDYYTAEFVRSESNRKVLDLLHSRCCLFKSKQWYSCF